MSVLINDLFVWTRSRLETYSSRLCWRPVWCQTVARKSLSLYNITLKLCLQKWKLRSPVWVRPLSWVLIATCPGILGLRGVWVKPSFAICSQGINSRLITNTQPPSQPSHTHYPSIHPTPTPTAFFVSSLACPAAVKLVHFSGRSRVPDGDLMRLQANCSIKQKCASSPAGRTVRSRLRTCLIGGHDVWSNRGTEWDDIEDERGPRANALRGVGISRLWASSSWRNLNNYCRMDLWRILSIPVRFRDLHLLLHLSKELQLTSIGNSKSHIRVFMNRIEQNSACWDRSWTEIDG